MGGVSRKSLAQSASSSNALEMWMLKLVKRTATVTMTALIGVLVVLWSGVEEPIGGPVAGDSPVPGVVQVRYVQRSERAPDAHAALGLLLQGELPASRGGEPRH